MFLAKGIEEATLKRLSEVIEEEMPEAKVVTLSGPSHAEEVSIGIPTAVVISSENDETSERLQAVFMNPKFRVYINDDLLGVEMGGSLKNIIALACGIAIGLGYGDNTITRVADVSLKERRCTVIVPRETPLRTAHIQNMLTLSQEGAIILPAMPGFYSNHDTVDEQINFVVGKILDSLNIENNLFKRWE